MDEGYQKDSKYTSIYFDKLPIGPDNEAVSRLRDELVENAGGVPVLISRLAQVFGGDAALFLQYLIFWSGKSHAPYGWVWKSREEMEDIAPTGVGLHHVYQEKARKILRGDKQRNKKTYRVIEEFRPSRRRATFFRVDLEAVADAIGIELYSAVEDDHDPWFDVEDFESPHVVAKSFQGTTQESESPHVATESPHVATESPHVAPSVESFSRDASVCSVLQTGEEPSCEEPSPQAMDREKPQKQVEAQPIADNVSSQNGDAQSKAYAGQGDGRGTAVETTPPRPDDDALLSAIAEILDPDSGKWWGAAYVEHSREHYKPSKVARYIADDDELPDYTGRAEEIEPYVEYLLWQESKERSAAWEG